MTNDNEPAAPRQLPYAAEFFPCTPDAFKWTLKCPHATTMIGRCGATDKWIVFSVTCKRWSCPSCSRDKVRRLAWLTRNAAPTRMVTLTTNPALYCDERNAFDATRGKVPELVRNLRVAWGVIEYLRVTEATKKGYPHYHMLWRSGFVPQKCIKLEWKQQTGNDIVDVRKISDTFNTFNYLVKYLTKLKPMDWTERHVSYSKDFFRAEDLEKTRFPALEDIKKFPTHPLIFITEHYPDVPIKVYSPHAYEVPYYEWEQITTVLPEEVGLPRVAVDPPPPVKQQTAFDVTPGYD